MAGPHVVILGAGIVGLSTATRLQQLLPEDANVTLVADSFNTDTTSNGAAGIVRISLDFVEGVHHSTVRRWIRTSWDHFESIHEQGDGPEAGIYYISGYHLYDEGMAFKKKPNLMREITPTFREMTDAEHNMFACRRREHGVAYTTLLVEPGCYLPWLTDKFLEKGGKIERRTVRTFQELAGSCDVLVNCTGLRAADLQDDPLLVPDRGQILKVRAPWIKHFIYVDRNCWIIPRMADVVVGGTRQRGNACDDINLADTDEVWQRACEYVPSLKNAEILGVWPGLRPYRSPVRIEAQTMTFGSDNLHVVHNYGHGGNGIGLSWATAVDASQLVMRILAASVHSRL